jgi:hypothetical protein
MILIMIISENGRYSQDQEQDQEQEVISSATPWHARRRIAIRRFAPPRYR